MVSALNAMFCSAVAIWPERKLIILAIEVGHDAGRSLEYSHRYGWLEADLSSGGQVFHAICRDSRIRYSRRTTAMVALPVSYAVLRSMHAKNLDFTQCPLRHTERYA